MAYLTKEMEDLSHSSALLPKGSKKKTELSMGDLSVHVVTDVTPSVLKQVRELVDHRFEDLQKKATGALSTHQLAVLVAYNLAEELINERAKVRALKKEVVERTERLLERVESHLSQNNI